MRRLMVFFVLGVLVAACNGSAEESTTSMDLGSTPAASSSTPTTVASTITTVAPSSTTTAATTTTEATTTTAPTTTTTVVRTVTEDPNLPSAQPGHLVDWDAVGPGWTLVLYDATDLVTATTKPTVLYLVDPAGARYEVASWPSGPYEIADWAGTGDAALVLNGAGAAIVDLRTGLETATVTLPSDWYGLPVSFTAPTGKNIVVLTGDGTTQRVERRNRAGSVLAVLAEQPEPVDVFDGLAWLYGYDGTFALVRHSGGIEYVQNDGTFVRDVWTPMAHRCTPKRWWTADSFVAACIGEGPAFPHDYYSRVWILKTDGTAGSPLNEIPPGPIPVVDFGLVDAWDTPAHTFGQWVGDCGSAQIEEIAPDGSFTPVGSGGQRRLISIDGDRMVVLESNACDGSDARLIATDLSGGVTSELVPRIGDAWGVRDAATLTAVYP